MLRSIVAQLLYQDQICNWESKGVPFQTHAYVPETDLTTQLEFHEREDHNHVLKVNIIMNIYL